jgi:hypothetical protein
MEVNECGKTLQKILEAKRKTDNHLLFNTYLSSRRQTAKPYPLTHPGKLMPRQACNVKTH